MTIGVEFIYPDQEFDADRIPAASLAAFCEFPAGCPRATLLDEHEPVSDAPSDHSPTILPAAPEAHGKHGKHRRK